MHTKKETKHTDISSGGEKEKKTKVKSLVGLRSKRNKSEECML
jgi:hypothetical protein